MNSKNNLTVKVVRRGCILVVSAGLMVLAACGGGGGSSSSSGGGGSRVNNTQPLVVSSGPANTTVNGLFTSVTLCVPGASNCQTIPDVQVDTGSSGLRILASQLSLSLPQATDGSGNPLANCITFADNSFVWGPLVTADVQIAGAKASSVPIQIIGVSSFPAVPRACNTGGSANDTPSALGANGILGIGLFQQDCGVACSGAVSQVPAVYFSCPSSGCSVASVTLQSQLQNPVWLFPQDNNGVLVSLPSIPATGLPTTSGSLIFGIGTQSDNALGNAQVYATDANGNFSTTFKGKVYSSSYLDTGSNGIFFLDSSTIGSAFPPCPSSNSGFSCPPATVNDTATNTGLNGASAQFSFSIANADSLFNTGNSAFNNLGGPDTGEFDWGLPFFFGRTVFVAIENQSTPGGPGPYWAY